MKGAPFSASLSHFAIIILPSAISGTVASLNPPALDSTTFADTVEWRSPDHDTLHLAAWQDPKRGAERGPTARVVFHSTHAAAACSEEITLQAAAAALGVTRASLRDVQTLTLGVEVAAASTCAVSNQVLRAEKCCALGGGLVVCGDYFGAQATFTSCVVSAEAAVRRLMQQKQWAGGE